MSLRIIDLIAANVTEEALNGKSVIISKRDAIYNPSNLGGGFSRSDNGILLPTNESITFEMIFKTDADSSGYEKYNDLVETLSNKELVWLRYGIPSDTGYKFAYRPGYVSSITKTEGKYAEASLVEKITINTVDSWMHLYAFKQTGDSTSIHPSNATNLNNYMLFSDYSDFYKHTPYSYPYYYKSIVTEIVNSTTFNMHVDKQHGSWYTKFGNVLDSKSDVYKVFAFHAPSITVSTLESSMLELSSSQYTSNAKSQAERMPGVAFGSSDVDPTTYMYAGKIKKNIDAIKRFRHKHKKHNTSFKASIHNYSNSTIDSSGPFKGNYSSYLLRGHAQKGGKVAISSFSGVETNSLRFLADGDIIIDTALWSNTYMCNGSSIAIDFSHFFKTTANSNLETLSTENVTLDLIVMRRPLLTI